MMALAWSSSRWFRFFKPSNDGSGVGRGRPRGTRSLEEIRAADDAVDADEPPGDAKASTWDRASRREMIRTRAMHAVGLARKWIDFMGGRSTLWRHVVGLVEQSQRRRTEGPAIRRMDVRAIVRSEVTTRSERRFAGRAGCDRGRCAGRPTGEARHVSLNVVSLVVLSYIAVSEPCRGKPSPPYSSSSAQ